ncbi:MotA/TolQ/ExbB proton channel family protein [Arcobacter sp. 15-2]|uniref:MotA/TolQ/ExbB proton channel family protein n=1 Tax=Arcobacter sp. 15-2 TaxID=3374109 RepID=UPI00399C987B
MFAIYIDDLSHFFDRGGSVLYIVFFIAFFLWGLLIDRFVYLYFTFKKQRKEILQNVKTNSYDQKFIQEIQTHIVEDIRLQLNDGLDFIKTLIIVCPLVGLLGTVTGMIEVFDVMAIIGNGDVKSMANGVSMATIPTMAGMVIALSGILFEKKLETTINYQIDKLDLEISKVI